MRVNAYTLAADPAWCEASVLSYYEFVDKIFISYDKEGLGWTGIPIDSTESINRLKAIDRLGKIFLIDGSYSHHPDNPIKGELLQRRDCLEQAGKSTDWVLEIDTDEILQDPGFLLDKLDQCRNGISAVRWPWRNFYGRCPDGRFLEIVDRFGYPISETTQIAIRPTTEMLATRDCGPNSKLFVRQCQWWKRPFFATFNTNRAEQIPISKAMLHMSWVRSLEGITHKVRSWGHARDFDTESYVRDVWLDAPQNWSCLRNFHPIHPKTWPRLRPVEISGLSWDM